MLKFLGKIYGGITNIRNTLFDKGTLKSYSLGVRTISVGNVTAGGTGKTPLVAYIANALAERGEMVCILTRGYGRKNPNERILVSDGTNIITNAAITGDEPLELARRLGERAVIVADANRVAAARWAEEKFGITAFVLDDGFQHRRAKRDLDIVCIDATDPFGNGKMLPAGRLREPLENLRRADCVVLTRVDLAEDLDAIRKKISAFTPAPVFECRTWLEQIVSLPDFQRGRAVKEFLPEEKAFAFCGLGNPAIFFRTVGERFDLRGTRAFRDHHVYSKTDIEKIESEAAAAGADVLITTGKDAVKLSEADLKLPCFVATVGIKIDNEAIFQKML